MSAARQLARLYDQYVAAVRSDDQVTAGAFAAWLGTFWDVGTPEPRGEPAAVSLLGGVGRGIAWYDTGTHVVGYVRGWQRRGCYQVPNAEFDRSHQPFPIAA